MPHASGQDTFNTPSVRKPRPWLSSPRSSSAAGRGTSPEVEPEATRALAARRIRSKGPKVPAPAPTRDRAQPHDKRASAASINATALSTSTGVGGRVEQRRMAFPEGDPARGVHGVELGGRHGLDVLGLGRRHLRRPAIPVGPIGSIAAGLPPRGRIPHWRAQMSPQRPTICPRRIRVLG